MDKICREIVNATIKNPSLWLVIDFDDVIMYTSQATRERDEELSVKAGLSKEELLEISKESREENTFGKKTFSISKFSQKIKEKTKNAGLVDEIINNANYAKFINQSIKKLLLAVKSCIEDAKISILTFGEVEFQKLKVSETGIKDFVDEVVYTIGPKKEVVEEKMREYGVKVPFLITIDDSPDNIDDYEKMNIKNYINIRFKHPLAKTYNDPHNAKEVFVGHELSQNQAAVDIWKIIAEKFSVSQPDIAKWEKVIKEAE